ncbi:MAG: ribbon-helix-helix protein, CopG family [Gemmatimonadetes bacterium]|nr:ribbon-helix-helix protein, CopG family [Gemmatimonadota bacterium]
MKTKLTVTIDRDLLPRAKRHARSRGVSLSRLIEAALRDLSAGDTRSFSQRWRGKFRPAGRSDLRYRTLAKKYL